jgi:hypothetical protein
VAKTFAIGHRKEANQTGGGLNCEFFRRVPTGPFSTSGGGGQSGGGSRNDRYTLSLSISVGNFLSHNNPEPIIGNLASPRFSQANQPYGVGILGGTGFFESTKNRASRCKPASISEGNGL